MPDINLSIGASLNTFFSCISSMICLTALSLHSPVLIYSSNTSYVNPRLSSSVLPHNPSVGVFSINSVGSPRTLPIALTSVTVRSLNGLKSPAPSPYLVAYPTQSSERLQVLATLPSILCANAYNVAIRIRAGTLVALCLRLILHA